MDIAENYRRFSQDEAAGRSPLYAELTSRIAQDSSVLEFLAQQPPAKRQPNLLLAVVRFLYGASRDYGAFREAVLTHRDAVAATLAARRTQTNEPARCAVLLPLLARLPQPLALLEVGAAAGLCLLPDRYSYSYGDHHLGESRPRFECAARGAVPLPHALPEIVWRAGIDLEPVDITDPEEVRWLEALVWPDQPQRLKRLREAIQIARTEPPAVLLGDLVERLDEVAAGAPAGATLVVFHTAVLAYLDHFQCEEFARRVNALGAHWISNEGAGVTPGLIWPRDITPATGQGFVIAEGTTPVASADPHGGWIEWLAD